MNSVLIVLMVLALFFIYDENYAWALADAENLRAIAVNSHIEVSWDDAIPSASDPSDVRGYYLESASGGGSFLEWPPNSNLVSYWKFDGIDTGLENFGGSYPVIPPSFTINYVEGVGIAKGIDFDGTNSINAGSYSAYNFDSDDPFSITFWIKDDEVGGSSAEVILAKTNNILSERGYYVSYNNGNGKIGFGLNADSPHNILTAPNIVDDSPTHIAITYDGTQNLNGVKIYVDGSFHISHSGEAIVGSISNNKDLVLGAESDTHRPATVKIDDLRIYSEELSEDEIQKIMLLDIQSTTRIDESVLPGTSHCYRVRSIGENGQDLSGPVTAVCPNTSGSLPNPLSSPPNKSLSGGIMTVSWSQPSPIPESYYITRKISGIDSYFGERPFLVQPKSYWKFDGKTNMLDFGSNQNHLDDNGFAQINSEGKTAKAIDFSSGTYFSTSQEYPYDFYGSTTNDRDFSITFWIKPTTGSSSATTVLAKTIDILGDEGFAVTYNDLNQKIGFEFIDNTGAQHMVLTGRDFAPHNVWTYIAITYDGTQNVNGIKIYKNAITNPAQGPTGQPNFSQLATLNNFNLAIGAESDGGRPFTGLIDELRIYDKVLTFSEIQDVRNNGNSLTIPSPNTSFSDDQIIAGVPEGDYSYRVYPVNNFGQSVSSPADIPFNFGFRNAPFEVEHGGIITIVDETANTNDFTFDNEVVWLTSANAQNLPLPILLQETARDSGEFDNRRGLVIFSLGENDATVPILQVNPTGGSPATGTPDTDTVQAQYFANSVTATVEKSTQSFTPSGKFGTTQDIPCDNSFPPLPSPDSDTICPEWENTGQIMIPVGTYNYVIPSSEDPIQPDPQINDVYLEIDYMVGHKPDPAIISALKSGFENQGINLHVFVDEELPFHYPFMRWDFDPADPDIVGYHQIKKMYFGTPSERTGTQGQIDANILAKRQMFHYAIFGHMWDGDHDASGISEIGGNDFMVTLGPLLDSTGSPDHQAGTLMHELGHNLGLDDGGGDDKKCKPNYLSVMSYSRQFAELIPERSLDYSRWSNSEISDIVESNINENVGIGSAETGSVGMRTVIGYYDEGPPELELTPFVHLTGVPMNVDREGGIGSADINVHYISDIGCDQKTKTTLISFNDWSILDFDFSDSSWFSSGASVSNTDPDFHQRMDSQNVKGIRQLHLEMLKDVIRDANFGENSP